MYARVAVWTYVSMQMHVTMSALCIYACKRVCMYVYIQVYLCIYMYVCAYGWADIQREQNNNKQVQQQNLKKMLSSGEPPRLENKKIHSQGKHPAVRGTNSSKK